MSAEISTNLEIQAPLFSPLGENFASGRLFRGTFCHIKYSMPDGSVGVSSDDSTLPENAQTVRRFAEGDEVANTWSYLDSLYSPTGVQEYTRFVHTHKQNGAEIDGIPVTALTAYDPTGWLD